MRQRGDPANGAAWDPFGSQGSHRGLLPYQSILFFVLDEAGPKMATTATMDTKWFRNQWGPVVCIGGPWIPRTGWGSGPRLDLTRQRPERSGGKFGGPGEIRTQDLFHAMVAGSITYEETRGKQKTCTTAIWTSFGPHALFHACLDLERSNFRESWLRPGPHVGDHIHRARARSNPPFRSFVQDEEKGAPILRKATMAPPVPQAAAATV
jgi:hypothetical protein